MARLPSPSEPVSALRRVRIVECGEPLVDYAAACPDLILDRPRYRYKRETLLRASVAEKVCRANALLPSGVRLAMIEGWRAPHIQRRMYAAIWNDFALLHPDWSEAQLRETVDRYSAPLIASVPPPHTTGGALDVLLADDLGRLLDFHSPYALTDPAGFGFDAPHLSDEALANRRLLAVALRSVGITNYPSEYWHFSYGDQGWAYRGGESHAVYGAVTPPDWFPDPLEDIEAPLEPLE